MCRQGLLHGSSVPHVCRSTPALRVPEGLRLRPHQVFRGQVQLHLRADAVQSEAARSLLTPHVDCVHPVPCKPLVAVTTILTSVDHLTFYRCNVYFYIFSYIFQHRSWEFSYKCV